MLRGSPGFTLLELLVTVAIVMILSAIAIPGYQQYRIRSYNAAAITDLRNAMTAVEAAITSTGNAPGSAALLANYGYRPSPGVTFPRYTVSSVGGQPDVHMHTQHASSPNAWHTRYPSDGGRIEIR